MTIETVISRCRCMDGNVLKLIAIASMLTDHIGAVLYPQLIYLRIIGRLAFPIFCFLLSEGALHTHSIKRYLGRMGIFALISELPFDIALNRRWICLDKQNVFLTLFIGLAVISAVRFREKSENDTEAGHAAAAFCRSIPRDVFDISVLFAGCGAAELLKTDYSWYGVAIIFVFYTLRGSTWLKFLFVSILMCMMGSIEPYGMLALLLILMYNGKRHSCSRAVQFAAYAFYPLHLLVLAAVYYAANGSI